MNDITQWMETLSAKIIQKKNICVGELQKIHGSGTYRERKYGRGTLKEGLTKQGYTRDTQKKKIRGTDI